MFVPRSTSPLSFEPLSTSSDDAFGSDSDNELDEGARAAKRRRIEQLGKSYLEGKQLFILSAGLKGPFDGDWKNPWKRSGSRGEKTVTQEEETPNSVVIPESVPRPAERKLSSVTHFSRATPLISDSEVGSRREFSESRQSSVTHAITSRYFAKPGKRTASAASNIRNVKGAKSKNRNWLKKDKEKLDHRVTNPPKSPSPTPAYRPGSRQRSDGEPAEVRETSIGSRGIIYERRISGFTPVNAPAMHHVLSPPPPIPEKPTPKPRKPRKKATTDKDKEGFSKPLAPASAQRGGRRGGGCGGITKQSAPASVENDTTRWGSLHFVPPAAHLPEFEYYRTRKSNYSDTVPSPLSRPPIQDTRGTETQGSHTQSLEKSRQTIDKSGTDAASSGKAADSKSKPPSAQNSHDLHSTTTESDHITDAQVVPHLVRSTDVAFSLNSTEAAASAKNTAESPHDTYDDGFSTQAAVAHAQKTLQDDLESPEKATPARTGHAHAPLRITPFHIFQTPSRVAARDARQSTSRQPTSTQAILNAISPFDLSTVKKAQPMAPHEEGGEETVIGPKPKAVSFESPTEARGRSGPPNTSSQNTDRSWDDVIGLSPRRVSISGPPKPADDTSARSTGSALPWPPSASTGGTRPQDGQGQDWLDNFDFNGAYAEAGSFLRQSFEYERDLSFLSQKNSSNSGDVSAAPDQGLQSFVSVEGKKRSS